MDMDQQPRRSSSSAAGGEKSGLKERMVRAREQLDDLVEQTAGQIRKITVRCCQRWRPHRLGRVERVRASRVVFVCLLRMYFDEQRRRPSVKRPPHFCRFLRGVHQTGGCLLRWLPGRPSIHGSSIVTHGRGRKSNGSDMFTCSAVLTMADGYGLPRVYVCARALVCNRLLGPNQARKEVWGGPGWTVDGGGSCGGKTPRGSPNGGAADASAPAATSDEVSLGMDNLDQDFP